MNKITIKHLVDFSRKTPRTRQTLVNNIKVPQVKKNDDNGGGNYWISALSCISRAFVENPEDLISNKIDELIAKIEKYDSQNTKKMFQQNIKILQGFEEFNFNELKPLMKLSLLKKPKDKSIVLIQELPLFAKPQHVFTFEENNIKKIGAIWFVAKSKGFSPHELAMVTDLLYRYLKINYSKNNEISYNYCLAVDVNTINSISYSQVAAGEIKSSLIQIVKEMKKLI